MKQNVIDNGTMRTRNIARAAAMFNSANGVTALYLDPSGDLIMGSASSEKKWHDLREDKPELEVLDFKQAGSRYQMPVNILFKYMKRRAAAAV